MSAFTDLAKLENSRNCLRRIARHDEPQFSKDSIMNVMERFVKSVTVMNETVMVTYRLMDRQVGDNTDIVPATGKDSTSNQHTLEHATHNAVHSKNVHGFLHSADLFNVYNMLNVVKNELLWTGKDHNVADEEEQAREEIDVSNYANTNANIGTKLLRMESDVLKTENTVIASDANSNSNTNSCTNSTNMNANTNVASGKGHNRRPSTASVASTVSAVSVSNLSDSESEISNENDSGIEFEAGNKSDNAQSSSGSVSSSENVRTQKPSGADKATELAKRCKRHLNGLYQCLEQMTEAANYLTARYQSDIGPV